MIFKLHNQLEFMNFKLKFEFYIVKKKNHILSIWGTWKDFRGPRGLKPSWDCVPFHVYAHFPMKRALNFYTSVIFSGGYVSYLSIYIHICTYIKNVRIIMLREKELQTSVTCFKEARKNKIKKPGTIDLSLNFVSKKIALYRLSK